MFDRVVLGVRVLFGISYLCHGLRWFIPGFWPMPQPEPGPGTEVVGALISAEAYGLFNMFDLVKVIEILAGLSWILGLWVPLTLVAVMPITMIIFFVDVLVIASPSGYFWGGTSMALHTFLMFSYLVHYRPLLERNAQPGWR